MAQRRVTLGVVTVALALLGWIVTQFAAPLAQQPHTTEDVTAAWMAAGPTRLGQPTTVSVAPGQTLVAFLVGTNLSSAAGTATGHCSAVREGGPVDLSWPVVINRVLTGVLPDDRQTVAIAGWTNTGGRDARIEIRCTSAESGVDHYVAIPTRTAVVIRHPWFQPWAWVAVAAAGVALIVSGWQRITPPSR